MKKSVSPVGKIFEALPAVQAAVKQEVAERIAAGEQVGSMTDAEMRERSRAVITRMATERNPRRSAA